MHRCASDSAKLRCCYSHPPLLAQQKLRDRRHPIDSANRRMMVPSPVRSVGGGHQRTQAHEARKRRKLLDLRPYAVRRVRSANW